MREVAKQQVISELLEGSEVLRQMAFCLVDEIVTVAEHIITALRTGGKVMVCGNGGSAADAQHFAAELVGRFRRERPGWAAIALTVDSSVLTSLSNDYGFAQVFARQVQALGRPGDILVAISTSGHSANVLAAVQVASGLDVRTVGLTGTGGGALAGLVDHHLAVPSANTAFIQQGHIAVLHLLCELVEERLVSDVAAQQTQDPTVR